MTHFNCRPCHSGDDTNHYNEEEEDSVSALYQFNNPSLTNILLFILNCILLGFMIIVLVELYKKNIEHRNTMQVWQAHNQNTLFGQSNLNNNNNNDDDNDDDENEEEDEEEEDQENEEQAIFTNRKLKFYKKKINK
jgi:hypothetical protein